MICDELSKTLGFDCSPLSADGSLALVCTPFQFDDGDALPVYVETAGDQIRFFDDGQVMMHFIGRGMRLENGKHTRFIKSAAKDHGATFTETGELETWAAMSGAGDAFARYIGSMLALVAWERDQRDVATDQTHFVEEVAMALRAWKPFAQLIDDPVYEGVSGRTYALNFQLEGVGIVATSPHPNAASAVLHKLVDIHGLQANANASFLVIIDDRLEAEAADREARVMQSVARVQPFTALAKAPPFSKFQ